jgi:hypothetical protein
MTVQAMLCEVMKLERAVSDAPAGAPELDRLIARIGEVKRELEATRGMSDPLVADGERPRGADEQSEESLDRALGCILKAAEAKHRHH